MKIIGVIPARYASTRFPGKPLADICGQPMIKRVYDQVSQVSEFNEIYVATDDDKISSICEKLKIPYVMTATDTPNHIHRIWEVSEFIDSDFYVSVNGDEPLVNPENIRSVLQGLKISDAPYFGSVYRDINDPAELMDIANVKIVLDKHGKCLYQSRNPIPSTKGSIIFKYKKAIGIECFNKLALDFFVNTKMGVLERIEDIDHLRFLENGVSISYRKIESESISVDTKKDLEKVRKIFESNLRGKLAEWRKM